MSPTRGARRNSVTDELEARRRALTDETATSIPYVNLALVQRLEELFPPRCKEPSESLEAHMEYAGHVKLVATLRHAYELHRREVEIDPENPPAGSLTTETSR